MLLATGDGSVLAANAKTCSILGCAQGEIADLSALFDSSDPRSEEALKEQRGGGTFTGELRLVRADGTSFPAEVSMFGYPIDGGEDCIGVHVRDITERRRVEEELFRSKEFFRILVENALDIIAVSDSDSTVRYINPAHERIMGHPSEEFVGMKTIGLFHPDDLQQLIKGMAEILEKPEPYGFAEYRYRHKDGSYRYLQSHVNNLLDDPIVKGVVSVVRDVTERRRTEEKLRFLSLLVQNSSDIFVVADADGVLRYVSPSNERVLGYRPEEVIGTNASEYIHPDDAQEILGKFREALGKPGAIVKTEGRHRHKDGSWRHLEGIAHNLLDDPTVKGMMFVARDVTERKRGEQIRHQWGFYETLLQAQSDVGEGLIVIEAGRVVYANEAFCQISGYPVTQLMELPTVLDLVVCEERSLIEDRMQRRLRGEAVEERYETTILHAGGWRVELEVAVRVLRRESKPPQLVAVARDITARKRAEEKSTSIMHTLLALHEAGRVLTSTLKLKEIVERLLEVVRRVSNLDAATLNLCTEDGRLPTLHAFGPEDLRRAARSTPEARAALQAALETKERQLFRVGRSEGRSRPLVGLCLPLNIRGRIIGVLECHDADETIDNEAIETLESLASQAASALENARLYQEVAEREAQLEDLVGKLLVAQEQERRLVAHEVHDGLTQVAIGTHQTLQAFADDHPPATATGQEKLDRVLQLARQTVRDARRVIADLRPTTLDDFGLATALRLKVETLRTDGWEIRYDASLGEKRLPVDLETALYRVAQEALTNVRKHALTRSARITLARQDNEVRLEVKDAGCGFDPHELPERVGPGERIGLFSMQERIGLLGGECRIYSQPGTGTSVVAKVPLPESREEGNEHES